jgi:hypothetical protein
MNRLNAISIDCNIDRRTVLKFVAGVSASAVAPHTSVSAPVLANNGEIIALSARAAADYIKRGELSAERYAQALLGQYKAHTNLNTVTYLDETRLAEEAREIDRARARGAQLGPHNSARLPACRSCSRTTSTRSAFRLPREHRS